MNIYFLLLTRRVDRRFSRHVKMNRKIVCGSKGCQVSRSDRSKKSYTGRSFRSRRRGCAYTYICVKGSDALVSHERERKLVTPFCFVVGGISSQTISRVPKRVAFACACVCMRAHAIVRKRFHSRHGSTAGKCFIWSWQTVTRKRKSSMIAEGKNRPSSEIHNVSCNATIDAAIR